MLDMRARISKIIHDPQATVSGTCGTGIIIQGRIVNGSIFRKNSLSSTEMIPKQYNAPLRHMRVVGKLVEKQSFEGLQTLLGTI